jgi:hypothetical protein
VGEGTEREGYHGVQQDVQKPKTPFRKGNWSDLGRFYRYQKIEVKLLCYESGIVPCQVHSIGVLYCDVVAPEHLLLGQNSCCSLIVTCHVRQLNSLVKSIHCFFESLIDSQVKYLFRIGFVASCTRVQFVDFIGGLDP